MKRRLRFFLHYGFYQSRFNRLGHLKKEMLPNKMAIIKTYSLSTAQKRRIEEVWSKGFGFKIDERWFRFYVRFSSFHHKPIEYYIPDDIWYLFFDLFLTNPRKSLQIDDKNMYDLYYHDTLMPKTVCRVINGCYMDKYYNIISIKDALSLCVDANKVIIKKTKYSEGGKNIHFWDCDMDKNELNDRFLSGDDLIIQEIVNQYDDISKLHPKSLNTIRLMTLNLDGDVQILSSVIRMGVGNSKVDNASSGGIVCGIKDNGMLRDFACDTKGNIIKVFHPSSGCRFSDIMIPNLDKCKDIVKRLAIRMSGFSKLISWDLAINSDGNPVLIESNLTYGEIDFHQMCNGPILGTDIELIKKVFKIAKTNCYKGNFLPLS